MAQLRPVDLQDRVALVTDGISEVGASFVDLLGSAGAEVAVAGGAGPALERIAIRLGVEIVESDPANPAGLTAAADMIAERLGRLDLLVCVLGPLAADLEATFAALREAARTMAADRRGGRILVVGRNQDLAAAPIHDAATELAADGITVNGVFHGSLRQEPDDWEDDEVLSIGTVRAGDVARAALWMLDPEVEAVTGAVVDLDVGRPARRG